MKNETVIQKVEQLDNRVCQLDQRVCQLDERVGQLDDRIVQIDQRVEQNGQDIRSLSGQIDKLYLKTLDHDHDLVSIKQNMMTKEDGRHIMETLDFVVGQIKDMRDERFGIASWLENHDERIYKIEKYLKFV